MILENLLDKKIRVSVITVCYNAADVIKDTIESVLNQDFQYFEYIVKDGNSTDDTLEILHEYKNKFEQRNIKYTIITEPDDSLYQAMNIGIRTSSGQWLNFMNAGDCFYDSHVLSDVFWKDYNEVAVLFGNNMIEDEFGLGLNVADIKKINKKMPFNHQAAFFNSSYIKKYLYDESIRIGADYDLVLKLYESGYKFIHLDMIVSKYRLNGISSTKYVEVAKDRRLVRELHGYKDFILVEKGKIVEAYIKEWLEKYCPKFILRYLNRYYKIFVKKYKLKI